MTGRFDDLAAEANRRGVARLGAAEERARIAENKLAAITHLLKNAPLGSYLYSEDIRMILDPDDAA